MTPSRTSIHTAHQEHGAALMIMLIIMVLGTVAFLVSSLNSAAVQNARDKVTADALAQAREALIGYTAALSLTPSGSKRPGDLPCPDTDNDGIPGDATYTTCNLQSQRIGRLPWKTLGIPDLRDGSGERLWYAVSTNFKNSSRIGTLNSDTFGTISVFSPDGTLVNDGGGSTGAVAVIIAPGNVLQRQDGTQQDRSNAGVNIASNYLDIATVGGNTEDNANFTDSSSTNGFIQGRIKDSNGNIIVNDQLLVITQDSIMQPIQKRVAGEVAQCLAEYASPSNSGFGRYPWAAKIDPTNSVSYNDRSGRLFGRVPDEPFDSTRNDSNDQMADTWMGNCNINSSSGWWLNWKEMVFYGLADAYKPMDPPDTATACGTCLSVNPPTATADKKFVVIVAGKKFAGQTRNSSATKGTLSNYLESPNPTSYNSPPNEPKAFSQQPFSSSFNDTVVFQ